MQVPSLAPTDKLYKFAAVSGIAVFLWALQAQFTMWQRWSDTHTELAAELAAVNAELAYYDQRIAVADSMHVPSMLPKSEDVLQMKRNLAQTRTKIANIGEIQRLAPFYFVLTLLSFGVALWGITKWYDYERPPRPSVILAP